MIYMSKYDVAAIIWPSYTGDENRTRIFWPEGYGEWQTVKAMPDKGYTGCRWPRKPLWGYVNEADPRVMQMQIDVALDYGVNTFIYDWYWYDNRPFLENCLNDGFLKAKNNKQMKFYLMWANHDATHLWDKRNSGDLSTVIWKGAVTPEIFSEIVDRTVEKYFMLDNYYLIDGCPVYMVFEPDNLIRTFGTTDKLKEGIEYFRDRVKKAGFKDLHLQFVHWNRRKYGWLQDGDPCKDKTVEELYDYLGVDSVTSYNWGASIRLDGDYKKLTDEYCESIKVTDLKMKIPFYPNLTIGWDNNVRFNDFIPGVVTDNDPEAFEIACKKIKDFADESIKNGKMKAPLITVNSWNEWTETSYLEPDDLYGYGYLEKLKSTMH